MTAAARTLAPGTPIGGRYVLDRTIGAGAFGAVFLGRLLESGERVAIKVLHAGPGEERFSREARVASQLAHPNIVRTIDFGTDAALGSSYLVMEYVDGRTLTRVLAGEGPLTERRAAGIGAQIAAALAEAHAHGVVHRDLKPDNVMLSAGDRAHLLDFGVAKLLEADPGRSATAAGAIIGTPLYMSPEQASGAELDHRADLYALGCILHEALTGRPPFTSERGLAVMVRHLSDPVPALPERLAGGEPPSAALVVLHAALLAKRPEERPRSAAEVARVLGAIARGEPVEAASIAPKAALSTQLATAGTEAERRPVSVLFAEVTGLSELVHAQGPEAARELRAACFDALAAAVVRYGGTIDAFVRDEVMALFGAPAAHDDDPERAFRAALAMRAAARRLAAGLDLRAGIEAGVVVAGRAEHTVLGDAVSVAGALVRAAAEGQILAGEGIAARLEHRFELDEAGEVDVPGGGRAVLARMLRGARATPLEREAPPMLGRERELELAAAPLGRLARDRAGGALLITGEAGLGKSRLLAELRRHPDARGTTWVEGRCAAYGASFPYLPFEQILHGLAGARDDRESAKDALRALITSLVGGPEGREIAAVLAKLIAAGEGGDPRTQDSEAIRRLMFLHARRFFAALAERMPLVLAFEDVHWMDGSSRELLLHLLPLVATAPILFVLTSRPEGSELHPSGLPITELHLAPLAPGAASRLVHELLGGASASPELLSAIERRAEGNPFFVTELVRTLSALGAIEQDPDGGEWRLSTRGDAAQLPPNVHGVILARIDRLDDASKDVLRVAAVIGRSFSLDVLAAVSGLPEAELAPRLRALSELSILREGAAQPGFSFRHALLQEAVYEGILVQRRKDLHLRVATAIEALFRDRVGEHDAVLAWHYARAEEWVRAKDHLIRAGDRASHVAADAEALDWYRQALSACERALGDRWSPEDRAVLERKIAYALFCRGQHDEAVGYLERALACWDRPLPHGKWAHARALASQVVLHLARLAKRPSAGVAEPDLASEERAAIYAILGWIDYFRRPLRCLLSFLWQLDEGERHGAAASLVHGASGVSVAASSAGFGGVARLYLGRALSSVRAARDPAARGSAHLAYAFLLQHRGELARAAVVFRRGAHAYWRAGDFRGWGAMRAREATALFSMGRFDEAMERFRELARIAEDAGDVQSVSWALNGIGATLGFFGDFEEGRAALERSLEHHRSVPDHSSVAGVLGDSAWCAFLAGDLAEAQSLLDEAWATLRARRLRGPLVGRMCAYRAEVLAAAVATARDRRRATQLANEALGRALREGRAAPESLPIALRAKGLIEWGRGRRERALAAWAESIEVAIRIGAAYHEARTLCERGMATGAGRDLEAALERFEAMGARPDAARARAALTR